MLEQFLTFLQVPSFQLGVNILNGALLDAQVHITSYLRSNKNTDFSIGLRGG